MRRWLYWRPHSRTHPEGRRDWPDEAPATIPQQSGGNGAKSCRPQVGLGDVDRVFLEPLPHHPAEVFLMADHSTSASTSQGRMQSLACKECGATYELDASYVCESCFGPLEVRYRPLGDVDVSAVRRRIQGGPQNLWRYADFLPLSAQPGPSTRQSSRFALPAGCTPLVRADRLARELGPGGRVGQERRRQPHPLVQGPRGVGGPRPRPRARIRGAGLRVDRQPGQLGGRPRGGGGPGVLRVHPRRPRGAEDPRHRRVRHARDRGGRQLRRRQPPVHASCPASTRGRS